MSYNRVHVRAFLGADEISLFESSLSDQIKTLGATDLKRRIERTRKLRDKARDLLRRQKIATRSRTGSKSGATGAANERTAKKATALDEALKRFETQQERVDAAAAKGATKTASKTAGKPAKPSARTASPKTGAKSRAPVARKAAPAPKKAPAAKRAKKRPAAVVLREALVKKHEAEAVRNAALHPDRSTKAPVEHGEAVLSSGIALTPPDVRAAVAASRLHEANMTQIQGHSSTQVRRSQSKRDRRGDDA